MERHLYFEEPSIASSIAEKLSDAYAEGEFVVLESLDYRALKTAVDLTALEVGQDIFLPTEQEVTQMCCMLPFPREEREYLGDENPRIYVACLAAYNHGIHHGMWVDALQEPEEFEADIKWMLSYSPVIALGVTSDEWAIHDYDGFLSISLTEYESLEQVSKLAATIDSLRNLEAEYSAWTKITDDPTDVEKFWDEFVGVYDSPSDYAQELWSDFGIMGQLEKIQEPTIEIRITSYINFKAIARDLELNGTINFQRIDGGAWCVFRNY